VNNGNGEDFRWWLLWIREMFVWEEELKQQFIAPLLTAQWKRGVSDGWIWDEDDLYTYSVRSRYKALQEFTLSPYHELFRELWSLKMASPTQVCVWKAMLEKLPTRGNLVRRRVSVSSNLCIL